MSIPYKYSAVPGPDFFRPGSERELRRVTEAGNSGYRIFVIAGAVPTMQTTRIRQEMGESRVVRSPRHSALVYVSPTRAPERGRVFPVSSACMSTKHCRIARRHAAYCRT
jgi:hypothetical protein